MSLVSATVTGSYHTQPVTKHTEQWSKIAYGTVVSLGIVRTRTDISSDSPVNHSICSNKCALNNNVTLGMTMSQPSSQYKCTMKAVWK